MSSTGDFLRKAEGLGIVMVSMQLGRASGSPKIADSRYAQL